MNRIVNKLNRLWKERAHRAAARAVLDTPPIVPADDGLVLFSMIGTRVLLPYLVAVKSLHAQLRKGRIVILDDGTLTDADRQILAAHLVLLRAQRIAGLADLAREDIRFVNRQRGAGTRILLDHRLEKTGIDPDAIQGYDRVVTTHMAVAAAVSQGDPERFSKISKISIFNIKLFFQNVTTFFKINLIKIFQKKALHFLYRSHFWHLKRPKTKSEKRSVSMNLYIYINSRIQ